MTGKYTKLPVLSSCDSIEERIKAQAAERRRQAEMAEAQQEEERKQQRAEFASQTWYIINGAKATLNSSDAILVKTGKTIEESKVSMKANE